MNQSKIVRWALVLALIIVLNLFFNFGVDAIYPSPNYTDFCAERQVREAPNQVSCLEQGGQWTSTFGPDSPRPDGFAPIGYCDFDFTCRQEYQAVQSIYNRNVFIVLVVLGLIALGVGFFVKQSAAVSLGLSLGGVLSLVVASVRFWSDMEEYLRVIVLGLALIILIWFGIKKLQDRVSVA